MKLLTTLAVAEATEFVTVNRVTIVEGIDCPKTTSAETRTAVEEAFNLTKWPNSASEWITGDCDASTGKGDLRALHLAGQKTNSGFYWQLETDVNVDQREELTLKYDMKMKEGYEFVKGGKLPGLFGGSVSCGGGANAAELGCFSTRLMWRREGDAELYLYAPYDQAEGFCDRPNYHCNFDYGNSVERGCFVFQPGQWHQLEERVKLNTPGQKDGVFMLFNNGQLVLHLTDLNYREVDTIKIMGMHFNTFYGGGDISWYPTELNWADFKNFAFDDYSDSLLPSDVDNCPSATCDANATCTSQYRSYACQCNEGYEGDGFTCTQTTTSTTTSTTTPTTTTPSPWNEEVCNEDANKVTTWLRSNRGGKITRAGENTYMIRLKMAKADEDNLYTMFLTWGKKNCGVDFITKLGNGGVRIDIMDKVAEYKFVGKFTGQESKHYNTVFQYENQREGLSNCDGCLGGTTDQMELIVHFVEEVEWGTKDPAECLATLRAGYLGAYKAPEYTADDVTPCVSWVQKFW